MIMHVLVISGTAMVTKIPKSMSIAWAAVATSHRTDFMHTSSTWHVALNYDWKKTKFFYLFLRYLIKKYAD